MTNFEVMVLLFGGVILLMFKPTWVVLANIFLVSVFVLRWLIVAGLVMALLCMPMTYRVLGWTPLTLIAGKDIYNTHHKR